jgi:glucose 1-dehydrogenase
MSKINDTLKKRVLITGAATGIGKATALELARDGYEIMINYYPTEDQAHKAKELAEEICHEVEKAGCRSIPVCADVSKEDDVVKMFELAKGRWGGLDVLINNAGIQRKCPSHELTLELFNQVIATNAIGPFLCSREATKIFLEQKISGNVITNSSVHQIIPKPQYLSYSMS